MPTISFPYYQASNRVPGTFADVDPSQANTAVAPQRTLILASPTAGSAWAAAPFANVPQAVNALNLVQAAAGQGSQVSLMVAKALLHDQLGITYVAPIADNGSGVAATGTIAYTVPTSGATNNFPATNVTLTVGEVLCMFNTSRWKFRVSNDSEFGFNPTDFIRAPDSTRVASQLKAAVNLECVAPWSNVQGFGWNS